MNDNDRLELALRKRVSTYVILKAEPIVRL